MKKLITLFVLLIATTAAYAVTGTHAQFEEYLLSRGKDLAKYESKLQVSYWPAPGGLLELRTWAVPGVVAPRQSDLLNAPAADADIETARAAKWAASDELAGILARNELATNMLADAVSIGTTNYVPGKKGSWKKVVKNTKGKKNDKNAQDTILELNADATYYMSLGGDLDNVHVESTTRPSDYR